MNFFLNFREVCHFHEIDEKLGGNIFIKVIVIVKGVKTTLREAKYPPKIA